MAKKNVVSVDNPTEVDVSETEYEKAQIIASARFAKRRDLIASLLSDGESYTIPQVESLIAEFDNLDFTERTGE